MIMSIDPGNKESAYVIINDQLRPLKFGKVENEQLFRILNEYLKNNNHIALEGITSYGMSVGQEVFDTCIWVGRFLERANMLGGCVTLIYRHEEKLNLCGTKQAKDSNIIQALVDRFAYGVPNKGKGSKKTPGWFYGFHSDIWQAYACAITLYDLYLSKQNKGD